MSIKRRIKDIILKVITAISSSIGLISIVALFIFIFINGFQSLSFDLINGDYHIESMTLDYNKQVDNKTYEYNTKDNEYYSNKWGVAFINDKNIEGHEVIKISYIAPNSPFLTLNNKSNGELYSLAEGFIVETMILENEDGSLKFALSKDGAEALSNKLNNAIKINSMSVTTEGGGIRGSLITTIYMILLTLLFALPLGIGGAIYLGVYAPKNKITEILRTMIDMISGIPSIIFGLVGAMVFIPVFNVVAGSDGGSILSGAATLAVMLLPTIIKTTEEAISNIPSSYQMASLALGASKTQTTFKIILANSIPGILTATLLSVGRIIGESAAIIFSVGTAIQDKISINQSSTTLAVHIWYLMGGDNPNYGTSCAISIVILLVVLILNILVKIIGKRLNRFEVKR